MIECPICKVINDDKALFCTECGQRFKSATVGNPPAQAQPPFPGQPNPVTISKSNKLHSPLLGGGFTDEYDNSSLPTKGQTKGQKQAPEPPKGFGSESARKGGLNSPLLGGGASNAYSDDDDEFDNHSIFPHRRHHNEPPLSQAEDTKDHGRGLRSPLLGSAEDDAYPTPSKPLSPIQPKNSITNSGKVRLHSPLFGSGEANLDIEEYDENTPEDPNVLRSPLLVAKTKLPLPEKPTPPASLATPKPSPTPVSQPISTTPPRSDATWSGLTPPKPEPKTLSEIPTPRVPNPTDAQFKAPPPKPQPRAFAESTDNAFNKAGLRNLETQHGHKKHIWLVIPFSLCLIFKFVYLMAMGTTAFQSMPFLLNQIGQLIVVICLIIIVASHSN